MKVHSTEYPRSLKFNGQQFESDVAYPSNRVSSQKFTIITFLPLALVYQFRDVILLVMLISGLIDCFPAIAAAGPEETLIPLAFIVACGMALEAVAEYRRWSQDHKMNDQLVSKTDAGQEKKESVTSASLKVGQIINL